MVLQWWERADLERIACIVGTPFLLFSEGAIRRQVGRVRELVPRAQLAFAVKANVRPGILRWIAASGCGFELGSFAEASALEFVETPSRPIVLNGPAPSETLVKWGAARGAYINADSPRQFLTIARTCHSVSPASLGRIGIRYNPAYEGESAVHRLAQFGCEKDRIVRLFHHCGRVGVAPAGLHVHQGERSPDSFAAAMLAAAALFAELREYGFELRFLNIGGGLPLEGHEHTSQPKLALPDMVHKVADAIAPAVLIVEPGKYVIAPAGVLCLRVLTTKRLCGRHWAIVDGGANLVPSGSSVEKYYFHVSAFRRGNRIFPDGECFTSFAGPGCSEREVLAINRPVGGIREGDLVVLHDAGAYSVPLLLGTSGQLAARVVGISLAGDLLLLQERQPMSHFFSLDRYDVLETDVGRGSH